MYKTAMLALIAASFATAAVAQKGGKTQPGGTTNPEVGFVRILSNGSRELRVSAEDGTGASVLHSAGRAQMFVSMGPRPQHQIAFSEGGKVRLLTYEVTSTSLKTTNIQTLVDMNTSGSQSFDFSPTGAHVAWINPRDYTIYLYNVASNQTSPLLTTQNRTGDATFTKDGESLMFLEEVSESDYVLKSVPITGGSPVELGYRGNIMQVEAGRTDDRLVLVYYDHTMEMVPAGGGTRVRLPNGYAPSLRCDDRVVIFQRAYNGGVSLHKYDLQTGLTSTFSNKDLYWPDYYPDC